MRKGLILLAAVCASASFAPSASAALIGPSNISDEVFTGGFGLVNCTYSNVQLPEGSVRSPISGTITRWRVNIPPHTSATYNNDGPVRLQVLQRTNNQPGFVNDKFKAVRQTPGRAVVPDEVQALSADLAIRQGQFIGLRSGDDTEIGSGSDSSAFHLQWCPGLAPGGAGEPPDFGVSGDYLLFNATVR